MKIIPIRDLRDTANISELCHSSEEPIHITKNGYSDMVIMSAEVYDKLVHDKVPSQGHAVRYPLPFETVSLLKTAETAAKQYGTVYTIDQIRDVLAPILKKHSIQKAVLFGSYAKGQATPRSDVDLLVDSGLTGLSFFGLLEEISNAFRVPVDLIDKSQLKKGSPLADEIIRTGVVLHA